MYVPPADRTVLDLLDRYRQLTTSQIRSLGFPESKSATTVYRLLVRLLDNEYVARVNHRRFVGGAVGGSGEYVWILTPKGARITGFQGGSDRARSRTTLSLYRTLPFASLKLSAKV